MIRVAVATDHILELRAAACLAAHPRVARVGLLDHEPPKSWGDRMARIGSTDDWDVVISGTGTRRVTVAEDGDIAFASPTGLARALGSRLREPITYARTIPGKPRRADHWFDYPEPLGRLLVSDTVDGVQLTPAEGSLAAVGATDGERLLAALDHGPFLEAICLAAAVFCEDGPVWKSADAYLTAAQELGLVIAEATLPVG